MTDPGSSAIDPAIAQLVAEFDAHAPLAEARMPPAGWYTSRAVHALEQRAVFGAHWQMVCRTEQVTAPGSWAGGAVAGLPWLVARGEDGTLRAFHNTCRHKGTPVARGSGCDPHFTCPYHGWRYHLDGRLKSAPRMAGLAKCDRRTLDLAPMAVATWGPLVLVHPDPAAPPLRAGLGDIADRLDTSGWADLRYHGQVRYEVACNWKVFCDNYLDGGYHIAHVHKSLNAQLDMSGYVTELAPRASLQSVPAASGATAKAPLASGIVPAERLAGGALYAFIHPNLMVNRYGPVLDTNRVSPLSPTRCEVRFDYWFAPDIDGAFITQSVAQSDLTQTEDIEISEQVQIGLSSPAYRGGPYAPRVEHAEHHFHRLLAADYQRGLGPDRRARQFGVSSAAS